MESTARSALLICMVADLAIPSLFGTVGVIADEASNPHFASVASVQERVH